MNEDEIVAALRRLGHEHEPDSEALWARVDPARSGAATGVHDVHDVPVVSLDSRRDRDLRGPLQGAGRSRPRPVVLVPLAAAAVLGVLVVSQVVTRQGEVATSPVVPATVVPTPATTVPPSPSVTGPATTASGDAVGTAVATTARTRTRTVTVTVPGEAPATSGRGPGPGVRTSAPPAADLGVPSSSIVPLGLSARAFLVTTPQYDDWVVVGARADGAPVRAKRPVYPQAPLAVEPPAGSAVVRSPLSVSWGDGVPEQTRFGASTWLAGRGGAWTVTTERLDVPRRLTIVGGGAPSGMRLDVVGPGRRGSWTWSGNPAGAGPFSLSVVIPGGVGPVTVTLAPLGGDDLAVSAVTAARI